MRKYTKTQVLQQEYGALEMEGTMRFSWVGEKKYFHNVRSSYQSSGLNMQGCQESESSCWFISVFSLFHLHCPCP